jgi:hypothetical protein
MTAIREFFARYEDGANSFDPDLVCSQFTTEFMGGGPNGVVCFKNGDDLRGWIEDRRSFFQEIGFRFANILDLEETPLDDHYTMAKVHWNMVFEKEEGRPLDFKFCITYFLFDSGPGPKVAFWISHDDEQKVMQEAGLIPADGRTSA